MQTENLRVCSTAHFTSEDNELLTTMAGQAAFSSWVVNIRYGYILVLTDYRWRLRVLKSQGASKALRRFLIHHVKYHRTGYIHFDCDAPILPGYDVFEWSRADKMRPHRGGASYSPRPPSGKYISRSRCPKGAPRLAPKNVTVFWWCLLTLRSAYPHLHNRRYFTLIR
ncbi:DUF5983 family protein [Serratia sp. SCBI]|uniref:DUF5983 family protein n=1 Tax=Serratia sp. SCBI TaxID=488142 RepID=UPI00350F77B5